MRLSKGTNQKASRYAADYILCEYTLHADDQTLDAVESVQTVRAVWTGNEWELHFVCKMCVEIPDAPGEKTAGVDLGICNTAAVSVGDETLLYPGNALKEDAHYFRHEEYETEGENGPSHHAELARQKKAENFALEFDDALTGMFIDRMDQNQELFAKFMDNEEVQEAITKHLRREVCEESQQASR